VRENPTIDRGGSGDAPNADANVTSAPRSGSRRSDIPPLELSDPLRESIEEIGPDGQRWWEGLDEHIGLTARAWGLEPMSQIVHEGCVSVVLHVRTRSGGRGVLKCSLPHREARHEGAALRHWEGDAAVRLLRASDDGYTLLLERCEPGHDLWHLDLDAQAEVLAALLRGLWVAVEPGGPFPELSRTVQRWERSMHDQAERMGVPPAIADDARAWAAELRADQPRRLLHGDLHPGNVLAAERDPWLAIDPKPWVGDPAFDLAQALANWIRAERGTVTDPVASIRRRAEHLAGLVSLDVDRVLRWATVKAIGWDMGGDEAVTLHAAASLTR
jgi:streptomycin 6-kinase